MQGLPWERQCDFCGRTYSMNLKEIPRVIIIKKVDLDELNSKDYVAEPDFCDVCIIKIIRTMEVRRKLTFKYNKYNTNYVIEKIVK